MLEEQKNENKSNFKLKNILDKDNSDPNKNYQNNNMNDMNDMNK